MEDIAPACRRHDNDYRLAFFHQGDRPVLKLAGGETFGERIGDLFQLKRAFKRNRISHMAAQEKERPCTGKPLCSLFNNISLGIKYFLDLCGHILQGPDHFADLIPVHCPFYLCQIQPDQISCSDLGDKSFCRSHSDFRACMGIQHRV